MNKKVISILVIVLLTGITFFIVFRSPEIAEFPEFIMVIKKRFLLLAVGCMVLYSLLSATIIYVISNEMTDRITISRSLYLAVIGQYYSMITPFSGGGQPAQIMVMKSKYDVSIVKGTTMTVKKFIIYQVVLSVLAGILFLCQFRMIQKNYSHIMILIVIGLIGNIILGYVIIMLAYTDVFAKKFLYLLLRIAHKIRLFKKTDMETINLHIDEYVRNIRDIIKNKKAMFLLVLLTLAQIIVFFSITYFVYLAFSQKGARYIDLITVQMLVYMVASFVPTPGNAGASEGSFYVLLKPFFPIHLLLYAMAIWRGITYYLNMIISGLILLLVKAYEMLVQKHALKSAIKKAAAHE